MSNVIVYKADNGDVFFKHNLNEIKTIKPEDWKGVIKQSKLNLCKNDVVEVRAVYRNGVTSYYEGDKLIGNAHTHVNESYNKFRDMVYLTCKNKDKDRKTEKLLNGIFK